MEKIKGLRDYALVAFLIVRGHRIEANCDGSFRAEMTDDAFAAEEAEYRLRWKPLLSKISRIKRDISASRPHAVNLDSTTAPEGSAIHPAAQRGNCR